MSGQMLDMNSPYYASLGNQMRGSVGRAASDQLWQSGLQTERQGFMTGMPGFSNFQNQGVARDVMTNANDQLMQQMSGMLQRGTQMGMQGMGQASSQYQQINQQAAQMTAQDQQNQMNMMLGIGGMGANMLAPGIGGMIGNYLSPQTDGPSMWQSFLGGYVNQ